MGKEVPFLFANLMPSSIALEFNPSFEIRKLFISVVLLGFIDQCFIELKDNDLVI
tara:strand:+ start:144 stop:308 length:165 start_codon:yes stop_codon:yes gene_type:complete